MGAARVFVDQGLGPAQKVVLGEAAARHLRTVLRLKPGAELTLFDGRGGEYAGVIARLDRERVSIEVGSHRSVEREPPIQVTLALGLARAERMDLAVQKAVELGASSVVPVQTERSVVRLSEARAARRQHHWQAIAVGACEQCGRNQVPIIDKVQSLDGWLSELAAPGLCLVPSLDADRGLGTLSPRPGEPVSLLIGPEGGLSPAEHSRATAAGFEPIRLGPRVLRTETAAIAVLTAVMTLWGDLG